VRVSFIERDGPNVNRNYQIVKAKLGVYAGVFGAAILAGG